MVEASSRAQRAWIILAYVPLIVMPVPARVKQKVGRALGSAAMRVDVKQMKFCAYLSAILLVGFVCNAFFGLWWAGPVAAPSCQPCSGRQVVIPRAAPKMIHRQLPLTRIFPCDR